MRKLAVLAMLLGGCGDGVAGFLAPPLPSDLSASVPPARGDLSGDMSEASSVFDLSPGDASAAVCDLAVAGGDDMAVAAVVDMSTVCVVVTCPALTLCGGVRNPHPYPAPETCCFLAVPMATVCTF